MVRNNAQGGNFFFGFALDVQIFLRLADQRGEQVRFKHVFGPLHRHAQAFQAHARINVVVRQGFKGAVFLAVVAFKHDVPNFHKAPAVTRNVAMRIFAAVGAEIVIDFGARTARAGGAHRPEVIGFVQFKNAFGRHVFQPRFVRFGVARGNAAFVNADVEFVGRHTQHFGQVFPGPINGFFFKIIAERKVAQHFKKR